MTEEINWNCHSRTLIGECANPVAWLLNDPVMRYGLADLGHLTLRHDKSGCVNQNEWAHYRRLIPGVIAKSSVCVSADNQAKVSWRVAAYPTAFPQQTRAGIGPLEATGAPPQPHMAGREGAFQPEGA